MDPARKLSFFPPHASSDKPRRPVYKPFSLEEQQLFLQKQYPELLREELQPTLRDNASMPPLLQSKIQGKRSEEASAVPVTHAAEADSSLGTQSHLVKGKQWFSPNAPSWLTGKSLTDSSSHRSAEHPSPFPAGKTSASQQGGTATSFWRTSSTPSVEAILGQTESASEEVSRLLRQATPAASHQASSHAPASLSTRAAAGPTLQPSQGPVGSSLSDDATEPSVLCEPGSSAPRNEESVTGTSLSSSKGVSQGISAVSLQDDGGRASDCHSSAEVLVTQPPNAPSAPMPIECELPKIEEQERKTEHLVLAESSLERSPTTELPAPDEHALCALLPGDNLSTIVPPSSPVMMMETVPSEKMVHEEQSGLSLASSVLFPITEAAIRQPTSIHEPSILQQAIETQDEQTDAPDLLKQEFSEPSLTTEPTMAERSLSKAVEKETGVPISGMMMSDETIPATEIPTSSLQVPPRVSDTQNADLMSDGTLGLQPCPSVVKPSQDSAMESEPNGQNAVPGAARLQGMTPPSLSQLEPTLDEQSQAVELPSMRPSVGLPDSEPEPRQVEETAADPVVIIKFSALVEDSCGEAVPRMSPAALKTEADAPDDTLHDRYAATQRPVIEAGTSTKQCEPSPVTDSSSVLIAPGQDAPVELALSLDVGLVQQHGAGVALTPQNQGEQQSLGQGVIELPTVHGPAVDLGAAQLSAVEHPNVALPILPQQAKVRAMDESSRQSSEGTELSEEHDQALIDQPDDSLTTDQDARCESTTVLPVEHPAIKAHESQVTVPEQLITEQTPKKIAILEPVMSQEVASAEESAINQDTNEQPTSNHSENITPDAGNSGFSQPSIDQPPIQQPALGSPSDVHAMDMSDSDQDVEMHEPIIGEAGRSEPDLGQPLVLLETPTEEASVEQPVSPTTAPVIHREVVGTSDSDSVVSDRQSNSPSPTAAPEAASSSGLTPSQASSPDVDIAFDATLTETRDAPEPRKERSITEELEELLRGDDSLQEDFSDVEIETDSVSAVDSVVETDSSETDTSPAAKASPVTAPLEALLPPRRLENIETFLIKYRKLRKRKGGELLHPPQKIARNPLVTHVATQRVVAVVASEEDEKMMGYFDASPVCDDPSETPSRATVILH